jgi:hypothetical protein
MDNGHSGTTLFVAAGGGGDALASLLLSRQLGTSGQVPIVASYSWDRRILDPLPGPRSVTDFEGVRQLTPHNVEVIARAPWWLKLEQTCQVFEGRGRVIRPLHICRRTV